MAVLAVLTPLVVGAVPAHADGVTEQFLAKINDLRTSKGLGALQEDPALMSFAQSWSDHMGQAGAISHNPALAASPGTWTKAGENVGVGPDVDTLFAALVASPKHYDNMVDPSFTIIGIGVTVLPDGTMYTTHDFEARPTATATTATTVARVVRTATTARPAAPPPSQAVTTTAAPRPAPRPVSTTIAPRPTTTSTTATTEPVAPPASSPVSEEATSSAPPPPPPVTVVPVRITLSLDQLRGLDPVL
jgi:hypothetical protein